jgi:ribosomal protein S1
MSNTQPAAPSAPTASTPDLSAEMQREINAAMDDLIASGAAAATKPTGKAGDKRPGIRGPRVVQAGREMRTGTVVAVGPTDVFLEFGPKELGVVSRVQWPEGETVPNKDDKLEVIVNSKDADGLLLCSRPGTVQKAEWELLEPGQVIEARVTGVNKGGLDLEVAQHRAFMPAGQVSFDHIADLSVFVGEKMTCAVVRVERSGRGNIVLSRKDVLAQERKKQAETLKSTLAEGQTLEGTVRKVMAFGAFVDIGGLDGLIHVGDITHDRVGHGEKFVEKYIKVGQKVKVQVLKLDWEAKRISLGMKQTVADPFQVAANDIKEGVEVTGRVKSIAEFGAFIEIAPGVEGLVHISELAWKRVATVNEVLKQDEVIRAKVLRIDPENRRISLSIKALTAPPEPVRPQGGEAPAGADAGAGTGDGGFKNKKKQKPVEIGFGGVFGGRGGRRGREENLPTRTPEEIKKDTPELRRLREKFGKNQTFKGGIA